MALDLHIKNNIICRSILKIISKLRDQISLRWQLTSMHSKFFGLSTEIIRQSKIKGPLTGCIHITQSGYNFLCRCTFTSFLIETSVYNHESRCTSARKLLQNANNFKDVVSFLVSAFVACAKQLLSVISHTWQQKSLTFWTLFSYAPFKSFLIEIYV